MYRGFNLSLDPYLRSFVDEASYGREFMASEWPRVEPDLTQLAKKDRIDGDMIMQDWFRKIDADVFISHSHADEAMALGLAGYLNKEFGLRSFVDSMVWSNCNDLLRTFDDQHCLDKISNTYIYNRRNYSTSHVHMMLASSLTQVIDKAECIIFLNTPASIQVSDAESLADEKVASPWIYHELTISRLIRKRKPKRLLAKLRESLEHRASAMDMDDMPTFQYKAPLDHLAKIDWPDIANWLTRFKKEGIHRPAPAALDVLYEMIDDSPFDAD